MKTSTYKRNNAAVFFTFYATRVLCLLLFVIAIFYPRPTAIAAVRLKELVEIKGLQDHQLIGYSLVVGLDGTGDSRRSAVTMQAVKNMMQKFGLNIPPNSMGIKNVASVMVTTNLSAFSKVGSRLDVLVSSIGDANSLEGGTLLSTPLLSSDNQIFAQAQGAVSIGGFNIETMSGERFRKNYALVGRVPNGAIVMRELTSTLANEGKLELMLREPDFTSAVRIADAINNQLGNQNTTAFDAGTVIIQLPDQNMEADQLVRTIASIEAIEVEPDQEAKVVINERTGTVVVGQNVQLAPAAVSHGNLTIRVSSAPYVSQPPAFSGGQTVVVPQTSTTVTEESGTYMASFDKMANVNDLAQMMNSLRVSPRDMIAIFQALKQAGSLRAKLVIM
jgi:flagellar P-ring protein precursor FlgI